DEWHKIMKNRMVTVPRLYVPPKEQQALREFQATIKSGSYEKELKDLESTLAQRRPKSIDQFMDSISLVAIRHNPEEKARVERQINSLIKQEERRKSVFGAWTQLPAHIPKINLRALAPNFLRVAIFEAEQDATMVILPIIEENWKDDIRYQLEKA